MKEKFTNQIHASDTMFPFEQIKYVQIIDFFQNCLRRNKVQSSNQDATLWFSNPECMDFSPLQL
jgi:hypothetical protein